MPGSKSPERGEKDRPGTGALSGQGEAPRPYGAFPDEGANFSGSLEAKTFARTLEELKGLALTKRPDIRALEVEKAKSDAEIALAQAERIPNVTAGIGYQRENSVVEVGGMEGKNRDNLIGLKISIPIPLFDRNQAGIREAQARKGSAESRYAFARLTAEREVEAAFARLATAEKSVTIYARDIIPQLEENLKLVQEAYRSARLGFLPSSRSRRNFSRSTTAICRPSITAIQRW